MFERVNCLGSTMLLHCGLQCYDTYSLTYTYTMRVASRVCSNKSDILGHWDHYTLF